MLRIWVIDYVGRSLLQTTEKVAKRRTTDEAGICSDYAHGDVRGRHRSVHCRM